MAYTREYVVTDWNTEPEDNEGIKGLRKAHKEQAKEIAELKSLLANTAKAQRTTSMYEAFANRGLDPRIVKFYPADAATDDESVDKWVEENKEYFGSREILTPGGEVNQDALTESEQRGYQIQKDIGAYDASLEMGLKARLDKIQYDPNDPEKSQRELMATLKEYEGVINQ